ncbi:tyrosine protein phosphatase [Halobacillus kuroshimensis]|uniref:Tyrosine-protein phosphatase n=1 Tax=Halobacillus kuroshimensis TaxID=302481 RepID=A0ABS3DUY6_9BACI|nr:CpsB/CapC family capsule biosynthesis tyrosine phosphatase [Halobacillus kuroshimensis]MBN8235131.1 tyrosine protein phosphatase [Halobacillus kuroshimensis]
MIDIHSHILPGVDDGAQTIEESIQMAEAAVADGITTIVATPHHKNGAYDNYKHDILIQVAELNRTFQEQGIDLEVLPGQENRIYGEMVQGLEVDEILAIDDKTKYVLVEFPSSSVPRYAEQLFFDLQVAGYSPVIVHPERNKQLIENPDLLYSFVKKGAYTQVTAGSLCGHFGKKIKKFSEQLLEANLAHLVASDAHNTKTRGFCMKEAYEGLSKKFGNDMVYLLMENAEDVLVGKVLAADPPKHIKKSKLLGLFNR